MKKRIVALALLFALLTAFASTSYAITVTPYGSSNVDGGLVYVSGNTHILWGSGFGVAERKTVTSTLYLYSGGEWKSVTSTSTTGYTASVDTSMYITITTSGSYKVVATCTTATGTATCYRYYNI